MTDPYRISLDLESVLADTHRVYIEELNARYPEQNYAYDDVDDWGWVSQEERDFEEFMSIVHHAWKDAWMGIPACEPENELLDAIEVLATDYIIDIVTARVGVEHEMRFWLGDKAILPLTSQFRSVHPSKSKSDLDYDYFIDDKPQLADNISDEQVQFLIDRPWNQDVEERSNVYRVDSVADVVDLILDTDDL